MTSEEYLELLTLSILIIPNIENYPNYDLAIAMDRQKELFLKALQPYNIIAE